METLAKKAAVFGFLYSARGVRRALVASPHAGKLLRPGFEAALWRLGKWRLWLLYEDARRHVPAYRTVWQEHGCPEVVVHGLNPDLSVIPITDKESYVKRFSVEQRCRDGKIPSRGVVIDESSGTSGEPNNWVRGTAERDDARKLLHLGVHRSFGDQQLFVINAFALGPWATGMNVSMSIVDVSILKSTGPDIQKIVNSLRQFGPGYRYLICGYPPFLKQLVDSGEIDLSEYDILAAVGGESMSESLRDYLLRSFKRVYSSFGASDLEINIAAENDFTIALRRLLRDRPALGDALHLPNDTQLQDRVSSFALVVGEDAEANKTLSLAMELAKGRTAPPNAEELRTAVHERLIAINQDYREASRFIPPGREPTVEFHTAETGPFAGYDIRLKRVYIKHENERRTAGTT